MEYGSRFYSRGLLIGVVGFRWRFVEYHLVLVPEKKTPDLLQKDFHTYDEDLPTDDTRPQPTRKYDQGGYMDLTIKEEARDILNILIWRSRGAKTRDLSKLRHHTYHIPASLTRSTMSMTDPAYEITEIEKEEFVLSKKEFGHIVPFLTAQDFQEGDRMEVD